MDKQTGKKTGNKYLKTVLAVIWLTVFCLLLFFVWRYFRDAGIIEDYNAGNQAFRMEDYESAKAYYDAALQEKPSEKKDCRIRINEALSVTTPITPESVTYDNLDEAIEKLEGARDILTENGCADENDDNGHNDKAQILKNEIDDYIEWLRENVKPPEDDGGEDSSDPDEDKQDDSEDADRQSSKTEELQKKMDDIQNRGMEERNRELDNYKNNENGYRYDDGKNW